MLPKKNRLLAAYDFRRVRRLGRVYRSPFFVLTVAEQKTAGPPRVGFVLGKKFDKRATVRNRSKRLLRHAVQEHLEELPDGFDLVFFARPALKGKAYAEVSAEVNKILSKVSFTRPGVGEEVVSHR